MAEHFIIVSSGTRPHKEENPENDIFYSCLNLHRYVKRDYMEEFPGSILSNSEYTLHATRDDHTKWSKSGKERQILYDITDRWNIKYDISQPVCETDTGSWTQRTE